MDENKPRVLLRRAQVAEMLGVEPEQVSRWRRHEGLPYCKLLHRPRVYYLRSTVKKWAERNEVELHPISAPFILPKEESSIWHMLMQAELGLERTGYPPDDGTTYTEDRRDD